MSRPWHGSGVKMAAMDSSKTHHTIVSVEQLNWPAILRVMALEHRRASTPKPSESPCSVFDADGLCCCSVTFQTDASQKKRKSLNTGQGASNDTAGQQDKIPRIKQQKQQKPHNEHDSLPASPRGKERKRESSREGRSGRNTNEQERTSLW